MNFLALLGWNPGDDREKMTRAELIEAFSIEDINKKSGVFDLQKLEWLNGQYLHEMSPDGSSAWRGRTSWNAGWSPRRNCRTAGLPPADHPAPPGARAACCPIFAGDERLFLSRAGNYEEKGVAKYFSDPDAADRLERLANRFETARIFDEHTTEEMVRVARRGTRSGPAKIIHPTRLAVTGSDPRAGAVRTHGGPRAGAGGARLRRAADRTSGNRRIRGGSNREGDEGNSAGNEIGIPNTCR